MSGPLIIGFEDSDSGRDALALGAQLAQAFEAPPLVVRVVTIPEGVLTPAELKAVLREAGRWPAELDSDGLTVEGSPPKALHKVATEREAIGIVVGSSHRGAVGRVLLGGTGRRLLAGAPCAVALAARGYAEAGVQPRRLAVAFDGSEEAWVALDTAIGLAREWQGSITPIAVVEPIAALGSHYTALSVADLQHREQERIERALEQGWEALPPDLRGEQLLLEGDAGAMLASASGDFDLLVVGSRGYGPLRRTLLGSTCRGLIDEAACSVLAVPRGAAREPEAGGQGGATATGERGST